MKVFILFMLVLTLTKTDLETPLDNEIDTCLEFDRRYRMDFDISKNELGEKLDEDGDVDDLGGEDDYLDGYDDDLDRDEDLLLEVKHSFDGDLKARTTCRPRNMMMIKRKNKNQVLAYPQITGAMAVFLALKESLLTLFRNIGNFISLSCLEVKNIPFGTAWYYSCVNNTNNMYFQLTKC